jgi:hypothetical protein
MCNHKVEKVRHRYCGKASRGVAHVGYSVALSSGSGGLWEYNFGHETIFPWGFKVQTQFVKRIRLKG